MNRLFYHLLSGRYGAGFEIRILMRQTSKVFGVDTLKAGRLADPKLLENYARFTADAAKRAMQNEEDPTLLHQKLYDMAYRLGSSVRRLLKPKNEAECRMILILLYRNIGIAISENEHGEVCVHSCYFSAFYTPKICSVISAIDAGIFTGIFRGGTLTFQERITEGHELCRADFR